MYFDKDEERYVEHVTLVVNMENLREKIPVKNMMNDNKNYDVAEIIHKKAALNFKKEGYIQDDNLNFESNGGWEDVYTVNQSFYHKKDSFPNLNTLVNLTTVVSYEQNNISFDFYTSDYHKEFVENSSKKIEMICKGILNDMVVKEKRNNYDFYREHMISDKLVILPEKLNNIKTNTSDLMPDAKVVSKTNRLNK